MEKLKDFLKFLGYNAFFGTSLFLGTVKGISGFMNLTGFLIWIAFILVVLIYVGLESQGEDAWRKVAENNKTQKYPQKSGRLLSATYILTLVYFGHPILAIVYLITFLIAYTMAERSKTINQEIQNDH
jgi:hypothetical protein